MKFLVILMGLLYSILDVNGDTEHVHIRLKIPKIINRHTHVETKYIHIFHPTPFKAHGILHRKDANPPQPFNATSMEIKKPTLKNFQPSTTIEQQHHKMNSKEVFNHRYKNMRKMKNAEDDFDFPTALPSHGTSPNAQNLKFFVLDPPNNTPPHETIITTVPSMMSGNIIGARALPFTSSTSDYSGKLLSSEELTPPPKRLNRIPPPIPIRNNALNDDSYEEMGKTKYWTSSGKKLGKKKPYHGPLKKANRAESKTIKMTIRPKNEVKVTKIPFLIKV